MLPTRSTAKSSFWGSCKSASSIWGSNPVAAENYHHGAHLQAIVKKEHSSSLQKARSGVRNHGLDSKSSVITTTPIKREVPLKSRFYFFHAFISSTLCVMMHTSLLPSTDCHAHIPYATIILKPHPSTQSSLKRRALRPRIPPPSAKPHHPV